MLNKIKKYKKIIIIVLAIIILISIDQISKILVSGTEKNIIGDSVKVVAAQNYDGVFGVGQKDTITFIITNIIVIGIILKFIRAQQEQIDKKTYLALTFIIAGALGNLIDRITRGYVLKIIAIGPVAFNISDILVIIGWVLLVAFLVVRTMKLREKKEDKVE